MISNITLGIFGIFLLIWALAALNIIFSKKPPGRHTPARYPRSSIPITTPDDALIYKQTEHWYCINCSSSQHVIDLSKRANTGPL